MARWGQPQGATLAGSVVRAAAPSDPESMESTHASAPADGWLRAAVRPLASRRGGTTLLHHLLGLPLGVAYFVWLVTGLSLGAGLIITVIGIPILTLVLASVRPIAAAERGLANALLGAEIPRAPLAPTGEGWLGKLKAYWTDGRTWRGVTYLLARFPAGLATFTVAVVSYGTAATLLAAPIIAASDADGMGVGPWEANTVLEGLAMVPFGVLALVAAAWISFGMGAASRELARWGTR
jgi:hypothetical protein